MLSDRKQFRALVLVVVLLAAACAAAVWLALPRSAPGASYTKPWAHPVPSATRFCGQGGDPASPGNGADPRGVAPGSPNPLLGLRFYVHPIQDDAYRQLRSYENSGATGKANLLARIALRPRGVWFGKFTRPNFFDKIRNHINCAQWLMPGSVPIMVVLRHQGKACHRRYTAGGVAEDNATMAWYRAFREAVGDARVVIAFEPDSIGTINCLARSRRAARKRVLRYGVDQLSQLPNATIYLEATASDWKSPRYTARMLRYIGIHKVRGFMLNVTHYDWTSRNIRYGYRVSRLVGGKPFVISTSYNGRGPVHFMMRINGRKRRINVFCNPRYRGVGPPPNTDTGFAKVDAFLWLNRPGTSGAGGCNGAPPRAGTWWPARALMFSKYATDWIRPPRGTRFGFRRRISLCRLGAPLRNGRYSRRAPERRCRR